MVSDVNSPPESADVLDTISGLSARGKIVYRQISTGIRITNGKMYSKKFYFEEM